MPICNLIEYSDNHSHTSGNLLQFKRDAVPANNFDLNTDDSKSVKYKAALVVETIYAVNKTNSSVKKKKKIVVPLNSLSNF